MRCFVRAAIVEGLVLGERGRKKKETQFFFIFHFSFFLLCEILRSKSN